MADLDITKNVVGNERHVIPGDPVAAVYSADMYADGQSISGMAGALIGNGYTALDVNRMTKNDMVLALRELNDQTYQPE